MAEILSELKSLRKEVERSNFCNRSIYTTKDAAEFLGVSVSYMQKLIASREITFYRPKGKLIYLERKDLEDFVLKNPIHSKDDIDSIVANNLLKFKL
ncbi:helix-turn-helix domain-containing protein [Snuella lapsa]